VRRLYVGKRWQAEQWWVWAEGESGRCVWVLGGRWERCHTHVNENNPHYVDAV